MNPKSEKEMFTRVTIFDTYCQSALYKNHYEKAHGGIAVLFNKYSLSRDGTTALDSYKVEDFIKII